MSVKGNGVRGIDVVLPTHEVTLLKNKGWDYVVDFGGTKYLLMQVRQIPDGVRYCLDQRAHLNRKGRL